jgi:adenosylcobyric acid synthase
MTARCIMVLGTTSGAGKSWLTTALCRYYADKGLRVAPFKAQNMSNNARVVAGNGEVKGEVNGVGSEIGSAQYFQALAARAVPDVRMNPLLLKPERDTHSQVVLLGQVSAEFTAMDWRSRSAKVWPFLAAALDDLRANFDVVVIEGAGSPAEINLHDCDIVNMRVAVHAQARCLLITDIDRGGAFAHLYGTWALLPLAERALIKGFVLNKFRGDAALLAPGPQMLQDLTGVPTVATLPMWREHGLPEEDGMLWWSGSGRAARGESNASSVTIAIVAYPRISNLDEFQALNNVAGVRLLWVRSATELTGLNPARDWIVLPGSKHTSGDLAWLRGRGMDAAIAAHAGQGGAVLGVCGGLQMLGEALIDPHHIDGNGPGLGLLALVTQFERDKTVRPTQACFGALNGSVQKDGDRCDHSGDHSGRNTVWQALSGVVVQGYEIHHGQTAPHPAMVTAGDVPQAVLFATGATKNVTDITSSPLGWQNARGNVLGVYLHGLFEDAAVMQALFGVATPTLDSVFDGLAGFVDTHFSPHVLDDLLWD